MEGPRSLDAPGEGTVFGLPLGDGELMIGVVIQRWPRVVRIGLVSEPVEELPASPSVVTSEGLGLITQVRSEALDAGQWPVVGTIEGFESARWPNPPMLPGEDHTKAQTAESLHRSLVDFARRERLRALRDATWVAEHPQFADPSAGTRYMVLPAERILPFVEQRLSWSGSLGAAVLERTDLDEGTFISTLPEEVGVDEAVRGPEWGGKHYDRGRGLIRGHFVHPDGTREPVHHDAASALTMVSEWLAMGGGHALVFREPYSEAEPPERTAGHAEWYESRGARVMWRDRDRYVVVPAGAPPGIVKSSLSTDPAATFLTMFLTDHRGALAGRDHLTDSDIVALAEGLEGIVIAAYDGEGFVVWTRTYGDRWVSG